MDRDRMTRSRPSSCARFFCAHAAHTKRGIGRHRPWLALSVQRMCHNDSYAWLPATEKREAVISEGYQDEVEVLFVEASVLQDKLRRSDAG